MREIKYRARHKETGKWYYGSSEVDHLASHRAPYLVPLDVFFGWRRLNILDPKTVGEYTGLKDKNSKEIYEGDIVTCEGLGRLHLDSKIKYDPVISFDWHGACIKHNDQHIRLDMLHNWEVVSNVHENPELMKLTGVKSSLLRG